MTYQPGETPPPVRTYEEAPVLIERRGGGTAMWIIAGLVAVVAIIAVAFMVSSSNQTGVTQQDLNTVAEQSRMQGVVEGAQSTYNQATTSAQIAADRAAADARQATAEARASADQARISAQQSLDRAAEPAPAPVEEPAPQQ